MQNFRVMGEAVDMDEGMGEAGDVGIVDAAWWTEQQQLRFFQSPMKEDAERDFSWACSHCTFQNAAGMWQCEMCSHHKPGESYYCVLVPTLYGNVSARLVPGRSSVYAISRWCVLVKTIVILESE